MEKNDSPAISGLAVGVGGDSIGNGQQRKHDIEGQRDTAARDDAAPPMEKESVFKALGWLDRFLAIWILLAMVVGVLLGNFVPEAAAALEKGEFVGVSVPIGKFPSKAKFQVHVQVQVHRRKRCLSGNCIDGDLIRVVWAN